MYFKYNTEKLTAMWILHFRIRNSRDYSRDQVWHVVEFSVRELRAEYGARAID